MEKAGTKQNRSPVSQVSPDGGLDHRGNWGVMVRVVAGSPRRAARPANEFGTWEWWNETSRGS